MAGNIYEMRFKGEYYVNGTIKGVTKPYEFTIKMDDKAKKLGFLHVFVRHVLTDPDFLDMARKKYPDWRRHRTHHEDGGVVLKPDGTREPVQELGLMNRAQLAAYINRKQLEIYTDLYPTAAELKQAVTDYRDNMEAFLSHQAKKLEIEGPKLAVKAELRKLNDWSVIDQTGTGSAPDSLAGEPEPATAKDLEDQDELKRLLNTV